MNVENTSFFSPKGLIQVLNSTITRGNKMTARTYLNLNRSNYEGFLWKKKRSLVNKKRDVEDFRAIRVADEIFWYIKKYLWNK